jgi:signal transduction histidine kinase
MDEKLRILHLEDVEEDAELVRHELQRAGLVAVITRVDHRESFIHELGTHPPDIILSDYSLPSFDGVQALSLAQSMVPDIPFIFVSGALGEDRAIELVKSGATDYLLKSRLGRIGTALRRALREVAERKQAALYQEQLRISNDQQRALTARLQSVREEERTRIARELHDELGQSLTALKLDVEWIRRRLGPDPPEVMNKTASLISLIDATIQAIRRIAAELRPGILDDLGFLTALEWQVKELGQRTGLECTVRVDKWNIDLDRERSTAMFRILQEALTNIVRHADATKVQVSLTDTHGDIVMEVRDNGRGITVPAFTGTHSLGILGMQERARMVGGTVAIAPIPTGGTCVCVTIPNPQHGKLQSSSI